MLKRLKVDDDSYNKSQLQMHIHALIYDIGGIGWNNMDQEAL